MNNSEKLKSAIIKNNSNIVIGLDSDLKKIPFIFLEYKNPVAEFNKLIIDITKDITSGYKLNVAFYEYLEEKGIEAMKESVAAIPDHLIKICDAKRGDLDNSAEMYARTYFDKYDFDSITLSPYMGRDSIEPFLNRKDKLLFIIALTSNESSADFQKLRTGDKYLYEVVTDKCMSWGKDNNVGFVFGANHTNQINMFTKSNPDVPLLIPGIGAQAHSLQNLMESIHSNSFIINSSRSIIYSAKQDCTEAEFTKAVRDSSVELNQYINSLKN